MAELMPALERSFGDWQRGAGAGASSSSVASSPGRGKVHLIDKPDAPQSVIVAAHLADAGGQRRGPRAGDGDAQFRRHGDLAPEPQPAPGQALVLRHRGRRQHACAARALFMVVAPVQTDKTKEAMVEVMKEIRGVAGERPLAGEEFDSIMRSQVARLPGRFETLDSLVAAATDFVGIGRAPEYYYDYAGNLRALSPGQLATRRQRVREARRTGLDDHRRPEDRSKPACAS